MPGCLTQARAPAYIRGNQQVHLDHIGTLRTCSKWIRAWALVTEPWPLSWAPLTHAIHPEPLGSPDRRLQELSPRSWIQGKIFPSLTVRLAPDLGDSHIPPSYHTPQALPGVVLPVLKQPIHKGPLPGKPSNGQCGYQGRVLAIS